MYRSRLKKSRRILNAIEDFFYREARFLAEEIVNDPELVDVLADIIYVFYAPSFSPSMIKNVDDVDDDLKPVVLALRELVKTDVFKKIREYTVEKLAPSLYMALVVGASFSKMINEVVEKLLSEQAMEGVEEFIEELSSIVPQLQEYMRKASFQPQHSRQMKRMPSIDTKTIEQKLDDAIKTISDYMKSLESLFNNMYESMKRALQNPSKENVENVKDAINSFTPVFNDENFISEKFNKARNMLEQARNLAVSQGVMNEKFYDQLKNLENMLNKLEEHMKGESPESGDLKRDINDSMNNTLSNIKQGDRETGKTSLSNMKQEFEEFMKQAHEMLNKMKQGVRKACQSCRRRGGEEFERESLPPMAGGEGYEEMERQKQMESEEGENISDTFGQMPREEGMKPEYEQFKQGEGSKGSCPRCKRGGLVQNLTSFKNLLEQGEYSSISRESLRNMVENMVNYLDRLANDESFFKQELENMAKDIERMHKAVERLKDMPSVLRDKYLKDLAEYNKMVNKLINKMLSDKELRDRIRDAISRNIEKIREMMKNFEDNYRDILKKLGELSDNIMNMMRQAGVDVDELVREHERLSREFENIMREAEQIETTLESHTGYTPYGSAVHVPSEALYHKLEEVLSHVNDVVKLNDALEYFTDNKFEEYLYEYMENLRKEINKVKELLKKHENEPEKFNLEKALQSLEEQYSMFFDEFGRVKDPELIKIEIIERLRRTIGEKIVTLARELLLEADKFVKRLRKVTKYGEELYGYGRTRSPFEAIPKELAMARRSPALRDLKLLEQGFIKYEKATTVEGAYYVLIDYSGSMEGIKEVWARAVALALLDEAKKKKRRYYMRFFDANVDVLRKAERPSEIMRLIMDLAFIPSDDGTDIVKAVKTAINDIEKGELGRKVNTITVITDGVSEVSDEDVSEILDRARRNNIVINFVFISSKEDLSSYNEYISRYAYIAERTGGVVFFVKPTVEEALKVVKATIRSKTR